MSLVIGGNKIPNTSTFKYKNQDVSVVKMVKNGVTTTVWEVLSDSFYQGDFQIPIEGNYSSGQIDCSDQGRIEVSVDIKNTNTKGKKCQINLNVENNQHEYTVVSIYGNTSGYAYLSNEEYTGTYYPDVTVDFTPTVNESGFDIVVEDYWGDPDTVVLYVDGTSCFVGVDN